jgi:Type II CAAX prenyl endopeptidase Rce1-like
MSAGFATWLLLSQTSVFFAIAVVFFEAARRQSRVSSRVLIRAVLVSQCVFGLAAAAGLTLGPRVGLGAPYLHAMFSGRSIALPVGTILLWFTSGLIVAAGITALDVFVFSTARRQFAQAGISEAPPVLKVGALFYGAVAEEVLIRLGALTVCAYATTALFALFGRESQHLAYWIAILMSTVIFALGHLPTTRRLVPLTKVLILRSLILNGLAGLLFGTLYCSYGIEAAMIAHGSSNLVFQFAVPFIRTRVRT